MNEKLGMLCSIGKGINKRQNKKKQQQKTKHHYWITGFSHCHSTYLRHTVKNAKT